MTGSISAQHTAALLAIAEAIETAGRALADAVRTSRGETKETGPELTVSGVNVSPEAGTHSLALAWDRGYTWGHNDSQNETETPNPYAPQDAFGAATSGLAPSGGTPGGSSAPEAPQDAPQEFDLCGGEACETTGECQVRRGCEFGEGR